MGHTSFTYCYISYKIRTASHVIPDGQIKPPEPHIFTFRQSFCSRVSHVNRVLEDGPLVEVTFFRLRIRFQCPMSCNTDQPSPIFGRNTSIHLLDHSSHFHQLLLVLSLRFGELLTHILLFHRFLLPPKGLCWKCLPCIQIRHQNYIYREKPQSPCLE